MDAEDSTVATWSLADMVVFLFAATSWTVVDGWMDVELFATATWPFVDGCRGLRSDYLVTGGWMLSFLLVDALPPRLHPPCVGDLCADVFFLWQA
jgi:hypothetical protein